MNINFKHENGDICKSEVSGFKGMIVARADHKHGCHRYYVQPPVGEDGKQPDGLWMDEDELVVTKAAMPKAEKIKSTGGFSSSIK